jgi:CRP-like cAMP-binding protein
MKTVFKATGSGKDPVKDSMQVFAPGEFIFRTGDLGTEMYIIQEGEVHILKQIGGEQRILSKLEKGDFFGEMAVLESVARSADAVAVTEAHVLVITGSRFDEMLRKDPEIAVRIIRKYSKRLREANVMLDRLAGREIDAEHPSLDATVSSPPAKAARHRLIEQTTQREFFISRGDETTIGRADPVTGILPDIDLTLVDTQRSVSRRHAKIIRSGDEYMVLEEVGTVNGTFVNDQRIPTGMPVPIRSGDVVKIGLVAMVTAFD